MLLNINNFVFNFFMWRGIAAGAIGFLVIVVAICTPPKRKTPPVNQPTRKPSPFDMSLPNNIISYGRYTGLK